MFLIIIGVILLAIAAVTFFQYRRANEAIFQIKATDTATVASLKQLSEAITTELGSPGAFREQVELKGQIVCGNPLTAELSQQECVYCDTRIQDKFEETYTETDSDGERQQKTRTTYTTISDNSLRVNFYVEDDTGQMLVNPNDAKLEAITVVDRFEPDSAASTSATIGNMQVTLNPGSDQRRRLGREYEEKILPVGTPVYILGEVTDAEGKLVIQHPAQADKPFLISHKTEAELLRDRQGSVKGNLTATWILGALGLVFVVWGLLG
ncbi:MAG: E3 ubiquitin ligase family protein [Cyanobacteria bacterium P01_H01_bin.121]